MEEVSTKHMFSPQENICELIESQYENYYKRFYNYFYFRIGNHHDAEDLTEIVFEKIINKYDDYNNSRAPFDVWVFSIARNSLIDFSRKKQLYEISEDVHSDSNPERDILENELNKILADAVSTLPEKEKNVLTLKYFAHLKNKEIAEICGYSHVNVGVILHRALKKMRSILLQKGVNFNE